MVDKDLTQYSNIPVFQELLIQYFSNPNLLNLQGKVQFIPLFSQYVNDCGGHISH